MARLPTAWQKRPAPNFTSPPPVTSQPTNTSPAVPRPSRPGSGLKEPSLDLGQRRNPPVGSFKDTPSPNWVGPGH